MRGWQRAEATAPECPPVPGPAFGLSKSKRGKSSPTGCVW